MGQDYVWKSSEDKLDFETICRRWRDQGAEVVVVQGLGFVGAAMAAALCKARQQNGKPAFGVIGIDLGDARNYWKIGRVRDGLPPVVASDPAVQDAYRQGKSCGNLVATADPKCYQWADIVVMDVNLDVHKNLTDPRQYEFSFAGFDQAVEAVARHVSPRAMVIVETTVPPGTTSKFIRPIFENWFYKRKLDRSAFALVHSYERVMPGPQYLASITNFYRVYACDDAQASSRARAFFEKFINTRDFPLTELESTVASELSKVLENSFRATTIAFMQEWAEFAERAGVNLFSVLKGIRKRPTHQNIMAPGFGVGGYCLPKDGLLADWSSRAFFGGVNPLGMTLDAIRINDFMPWHAAKKLEIAVGSLSKKQIALLGVSYLPGIADTRSSPSANFVKYCEEAGAKVFVHDPLLSWWPEMDRPVKSCLEDFRSLPCEILVAAVRHPEYLAMTANKILKTFPGIRVFLDANDILPDSEAEKLQNAHIRVLGVGKGNWEIA